MPRCKSCASCTAVAFFRRNNGGRKNAKKVKTFEKNHPCQHPITSNKKRRVTEMDALASGGSGGRLRTGMSHHPTPSLECDSKARAACPDGSYDEDIHFNQVTFDDYAALVLQCTEIARTTISSDVKLERQSMITKMRGLLDPKMKAEVDYEEASKDVSNVWLQWSTGEAAGKRAFIPTIEDRDQYYAALQIFCHAADEAKIISQEFCKEFGDPGIGLYNELVSMIGERDKNCLPFVNMCLRTWIEHLRDDPDLWADTYQFDFDKWVVEKMGEPMSTHCGGKTSYKLMMFVFGKEQGKLPQNTIERPNTDRPTANFTMPEGIPSAKLSSRTSSKSRSSKIKKIGDMVKRRLIKSNELHGKYCYTRRANDEIKAAIAETEEDDLNKYMQ